MYIVNAKHHYLLTQHSEKENGEKLVEQSIR